MKSVRTRITAPIAIVMALLLAPALSGCFGNPIENIIEDATGGEVDLPGTTLPEGFPSEVPLIDGEVIFGTAFGDGATKVYNVSVKVGGAEAFEEIKTQLEDAGFTSNVDGSIDAGGTGGFSNDTWSVLVVVTNDGGEGFIANYTVSDVNQT